MVTDTEGIVLRQTKALGGRRMITLFSKKYGKISVGTSLNEGGRNKTALAVKAFAYGKYELFVRDGYEPQNADDDVRDNVEIRLKKLEEMMASE